MSTSAAQKPQFSPDSYKYLVNRGKTIGPACLTSIILYPYLQKHLIKVIVVGAVKG